MPLPDDALEQISLHSGPLSPGTRINFADEVTEHRYPKPGDARSATHQHYDDKDLGIAYDKHGVAFRDPYSKDAYESTNQLLHPPQSATIARPDAAESLRTKMGRFSSTPDLSLSNPRQIPAGAKKPKVKDFFQHHPAPTAASSRSIRSRVKGEASETEGLVRSPHNDFAEADRNSMDEPWSSGAESEEEGGPRPLPRRDGL
jgi:hypothetical protein